MPSDGIRPAIRSPYPVLPSAGLVAQVRSAYTRSHPELGRETRLRQWYYCLSSGRVGRRQALKPVREEEPIHDFVPTGHATLATSGGSRVSNGHSIKAPL